MFGRRHKPTQKKKNKKRTTKTRKNENTKEKRLLAADPHRHTQTVDIVAGYRIPVVGCQLPVTGCRLPVVRLDNEVMGTDGQ